ncbi:MAG: MFS transporter [Caldisphaeraceae archaeon]|nr:MFS transporter [Caldisphaeraceae archaeon]
MKEDTKNDNPFKYIDDTRTNKGHIKVWFTAGMGFFTDAYDLFVIGIILVILSDLNSPSFPQTIFYKSILASSAVFTAILGQLIFGRIADILGRKKVYGVEASILAAGALLSAFSPNIYWLIFSRFLLGFGIGGDYPISATIMSEYSPRKDRGKLVSLVFANQGIGIILAVIVGILSATFLPISIAWRVMAGIGAIPPALVIYYRRKVPETPRFSLLVKNDMLEASKAFKTVGKDVKITKVKSRADSFMGFVKSYYPLLIGTSLTWLLMDIAFYGTGVFSGPITLAILGGSAGIKADVIRAGIPLLIGVPGYFIAAYTIDKLGRKLIQSMGFVVMAIIYGVISFSMITVGSKVIGFSLPTTLAYIMFGIAFMFINFGPNTTTFVIPSEVYPVRFRSTGHGISAASGKLGAAISLFLFPYLSTTIGIKDILLMLSIVSVIGALVTIAFIYEPKTKSLEEISKEKIIIEEPTPEVVQ